MNDSRVTEGELDSDWGQSYARFDEYKRTGEYLDAVVEMKDFRDAVSERFAEG